MFSMEERFKKDSRKEKMKLAYALSFAFQLGASIVFPILFFGFFGFKLDEKFHSKPFLFISLLVFGAFVAGYSVYKWLKPIIKD